MGAITHVDEIIGLEKKIKAVAGEGGGADSGMIAEAYNPNSTTPISVGDLKVHENKLYRCKEAIPVNAGEFDPTMWDQVAAYDETATYNTGDNVEYAASVYSCNEDNVTGEFDLTKWTAVSYEYPLYDEDETYVAGVSKVAYGDHYYVAGSNYEQGGVVGPFNPSKWDETSVEEEISRIEQEVVNYECIADEYDETLNPSNKLAYKVNSYVIYNSNLYKSRFPIYTKAGAFKPDMWDMATTYDTQEQYALGDITVYNGNLYKCTSETGATGEWDSSKWTQQFPTSYNIAFSYYNPDSVVEYNGDYYKANVTYENDPVGPFDATRWSKTQVASNLVTTIKQYTYTGDPTETKTSQITIPVSGVAPTNVFKGTITTYNDAGQDCATEFIINATGAQSFGGSGKCVLVIPGYVSVKFLILTITLDTVGSNRIKVELNRITEIGLVEGSLSISTDTEMIFPPVTIRLESYSTNVVRQTNS